MDYRNRNTRQGTGDNRKALVDYRNRNTRQGTGDNRKALVDYRNRNTRQGRGDNRKALLDYRNRNTRTAMSAVATAQAPRAASCGQVSHSGALLMATSRRASSMGVSGSAMAA